MNKVLEELIELTQQAAQSLGIHWNQEDPSIDVKALTQCMAMAYNMGERDKTIKEMPGLHIIVDDGEVFEGTPEMFEDFCGGPTDKESIIKTCAREGWGVKFLESPIGKTIESLKFLPARTLTLNFTDGTSIGVEGEPVCCSGVIMRLVETKV